MIKTTAIKKTAVFLFVALSSATIQLVAQYHYPDLDYSASPDIDRVTKLKIQQYSRSH